MSVNVYKNLVTGGGFSLPYLLHLSDTSETDIYLINDVSDLTYNSHTYQKSAFTVSNPGDGSTEIEIELVDNGNAIINLLENSSVITADIIGVMNENGEIEQIENFSRKYCTATWDKETATLSFIKDDRLEMTFPTLIWSTYNNRGNS